MKKLFIIAACCLPLLTNAQLVESGHVLYERKTNVHRTMEGEDWFDNMKSQIPKFSITTHDLFFTDTKTYWKPAKEVEGQGWMRPMAAENQVYTDLTAHRVTSFKPFFDQKFLIQDSQRIMRWKIGQEVRTIAGYSCRKAVGILADSVYVVAFYAEDIPTSGGPEMFGGLPGLILELAIPRLHTTWIAQKVEATAPKSEDFIIPEKGKKMTNKQLYTTLKSTFEDWGSFAARTLWWAML